MTGTETPADTARVVAALPSFSTFNAETIVADLRRLLDENRREIAALTSTGNEPTFDSLVKPLEDLGDRLNRFWSPVGHLHGVADNEALRTAYNEAIPLLSQYASELAQSDALFAAFKSLAQSPAYAACTDAERRVIDNALRDFRLGGIELDEERRARFRDVTQRLAQLATRFEENVLDATQAWSKDVADADSLGGIPASALDVMRQNAARNGGDGYRLTLDFPCYLPVMTYCDNRELRAEMYAAYVTRASDEGPFAGRFDNSAVIAEILELRHELAGLLGFESYAEYSLATKMAGSVDAVLGFLDELAAKSHPAAVRDYEQLQSFAAATLGLDAMEPWDVAYCSEKLRQQSFAFSQEALRPYFAVPNVLAGLFATVERLFDIRIAPVADVDRWHEDVTVYEIRDAADALRGLFYLDLYARQNKRGGAWMDECQVRRSNRDNVIQTPVAFLNCNFTPPVGERPALLTHDEVTTLFHEFGHGLHHMLTLIDHAAVSGINGVPWDGVELPSQFLENWCWEREALDLFARHVDSGERIPDELFERMHAAKNFQAGMQMVRQLEFSLFDFRLHAEYRPDLSVQGLLDDIRRQVAVVQPPACNRFQHGFTHIFAGGYGAGYYSYKWAEVLSADAFSRFEEDGVFNPHTGTAFRECILERGGAEDPLVLFERFRGRLPAIEPLLRHAGLAT